MPAICFPMEYTFPITGYYLHFHLKSILSRHIDTKYI